MENQAGIEETIEQLASYWLKPNLRKLSLGT